VFFDEQPMWGTAHWKLSAIERYAGERAAAWIDDSFNDACREWAAERSAATFLVHSDPAIGITDEHVRQLEEWARVTQARSAPPRES
jgi:hypothetical protein